MVAAAIAFADTDQAFGLDDPRTHRARFKLRDAAAKAAAGDDPPWALVPVMEVYIEASRNEADTGAPVAAPASQ